MAPFFESSLGVYSRHMANIASARKRTRQAEKRRRHNAALRSELRSAIRDIRKAITAGDKNAARTVFQRAVGVIDTIADKRVIHKNAAARHKSRLAARIKAMA
jgi:small subunit ribosomal protein S20